MSTSIWDDPEIKSGGEFVKFDSVGDEVEGVITAIRTHTFEGKDGIKIVPQLHLTLDDGEERTLTAGQVRLKAALVEQRPEVGDRIKVKLTQVEPRGGGKTLKHFDVVVTKGKAAGDEPPF